MKKTKNQQNQKIKKTKKCRLLFFQIPFDGFSASDQIDLGACAE